MKRRVTVEVITPGAAEGRQTTLDYNDQYEGAMASAIEEVIDLSFAPVEGEKSYAGWSRCTINVSGHLCTTNWSPYGSGIPQWGEECLNTLEHEDEKATQICWECQEKAEGGEE